MHDRIRLALSAAGIAAVTLLVSGRPLPFKHADAKAQPAAVTSIAADAAPAAPVSTEIPVVSEAPNIEHPEFHAPRIRRTAGADLTQA